MVTTIIIDKLTFRAKAIPRKKIMAAWKTLTEKPLPKVAAFQLNDRDFDNVIELTKCPDDQKREIAEWGRTLSTKGTDACVYSASESAVADYVVLIRKNPYHSLEEILKHELSHIVKGDL